MSRITDMLRAEAADKRDLERLARVRSHGFLDWLLIELAAMPDIDGEYLEPMIKDVIELLSPSGADS